MSKSICIVGFDPSLNNWGVARAELDLVTLKLSSWDLDIIQTQPAKGKQLRVNVSDMERATHLAEGAFFYARQAQIICVEVPVGSQSARAMASYGVCLGVLGALRAESYPFIHLSPSEVKKIFTGDKDASKEKMMNKALELYPTLPCLRHKDGSVNVSKFEHQADAVAAIHAGIASQQFKSLIKLFGATHANRNHPDPG